MHTISFTIAELHNDADCLNAWDPIAGYEPSHNDSCICKCHAIFALINGR